MIPEELFRSMRWLVGLLSLLALTACSSTKEPPATSGATTCEINQLQVVFAPMFSAYDGVHPFKVPATVVNVDPATIKWSASNPAMVDIASDVDVNGVMISPRDSGTVNIIATAGKVCGVSLLTITQATPEDWMIGNMRYNNGVVLIGPVPVGGSRQDAAMKDVACTNCHGPTATTNAFRTVSHTPQQTGGFSDDDLLNIFTKGMVPLDGYFDSTVVPYSQWRQFHTWQMTPQEAKGVIVYLRSLTPEAQAGSRGTFGLRRPDAGLATNSGPEVDAGQTD
jgi:uncharacterized membrane protein